jgi:hypothetical protein
MRNARTPALAGLALLAGGLLGGGLAACGGTPASGGSGSDAPDDASRSSFCASLATLTGGVSPKKAADTLGRVGTPSDIGSDARHGFEVLLGRLRELPPHGSKSVITHMARGLRPPDQQDVAAFLTYYAGECRRLPTDAAS